MTHAELQALAAVWLAQDEPVFEIEVLDHKGSVPRECGARMLIRQADTAGTIGGGHLEWKVIEATRGLLALGDNGPHDWTYPLGPALGQCCGGIVTVRSQLLTAERLMLWPNIPPRLHLQLFGAGHVGRAIIRVLETLHCAVQWIDVRADAFPAEASAAHIERVWSDPIETAVADARAGSAYLILTHSHDLDLRITESILRRNDFSYCGVIGSETKRRRFTNRLATRGLPDTAINRMTCPIGVAGISGKEPEIIAIAVVAELLKLQPTK